MSTSRTLTPPSRWQALGELRAPREAVRLAIKTPSLVRSPRGDGAPVVVVPGFGATDASMGALRSFLRRMGHDSRPAGLGRIDDDVDGQRIRLGETVEDLHRGTNRLVDLVGWSLGGVLAREAARDLPDAVRRVVTFGTPVEGGPSYTSLAHRYSEDDLQAVRDMIAERNRVPLRTPVTAIWSRRDGVVSPRSCIDDLTPGVEHVQVSSTHLGMGFDPDVWSVIADRLAAPDRTRSGDVDRAGAAS